MLKKIVSYIGIYTILFNSIYSVFIFDQSFANNDLSINQPNNKTHNTSDYKNYSTDTVIVKFKNSTSSSRVSTNSIQNNLSSFGKSNIDLLDDLNMGVIHFDKSVKDINKVVASLKTLNNVEYVEPDYVRNISYTGVVTNDTYSNQQWYLDSISSTDAWKMYNDTENKTTVSITDTGFDYTHGDLVGTLKDLSSNCKDDSGNVIAGGCANHGWNFEGSGSYDSGTAIFPENEIYDMNGHGTHIAGTIGAVGNNGTGVIGVTKNADIMGARIYSYHNNYAMFYVSNTIRALNFAIQNGAKVVNASYGGTSFSQAEYDAINVAKSSGVLVIAAAGNTATNNDGVSPFYPASYDLDNIISVASVGGNDVLASYSNYGATSVDVAAPGGDMGIQDTGILSTYPYYQTVWSDDMNSFSGITLTGTGLDWNIYNGTAIESQSGAFNWNSTYAGNEDKTLIFDQTFDLSGAKFAKFSGYFECELSAGDNLEVSINDQVIGSAYPYWTYARAVAFNFIDVELPIPQNLYTAGSQVKIRFVSNGDATQSYGCTMDNLAVQRYDINNNTYASIQGTSMATPVVTGLAAMLWSYKPELTYLQVKDIILSSVDVIINLNSKVITSGKINSKNAIKELISRYGITKNGIFEGASFNTNYLNLNGKNIVLSGSIVDLSGTGTVISLSGSTISGTGYLNFGTGTSLYNNGTNFLSTSSDFDIQLKNSLGTVLNGSGITTFGDSLILDYTGSKVGNLNIQLFNSNYGYLYNGPLSNSLSIPINQSFTGGVTALVYKDGDVANGVSSGVTLKTLDKTIIDNFTFNLASSSVTGSLNFASGSITNSTGTTLNLLSSEYPVNYEITGDIVGSYTGVLNSTGLVNLELTPGSGVKNMSVIYTNTGSFQSPTYTGSIILDQTPALLSFMSHTNNQQVNQSSISLTGSVSDTNGISSLLVNGSLVSILSNSFSKIINLIFGNNTVSYQLTDNALNQSTGSINIVRIADAYYDVDNNSGSIVNTGSLLLTGNNSTSTGVVFNSTGSITINSSTGSNRVVLSLSGLTIGSSSWDGLFNPPSQITFSGSFNTSGYTHIPSLSFDIGSQSSELNLTGSTAQVSLFVGTSQNGNTLSIFRSINNGISYSLLTTCLVSSGICTFNTDKFSLFTLASVASGGSSSSSSSSSSTSGGGSSSGGSSMGGLVAIASTCSDIQLECRVITTGTGKTNKWYKKDGITCEGGNLGKACSIENVIQKIDNAKKLQPIKYLGGGYVFKTKILEKIFNKKKELLTKIDDELINLSYLSKNMEHFSDEFRTSYSKLLDSIHKIDEFFVNKNIESAKTEFKNFLSINNNLIKYNSDLNVKYVEVYGDKVYYLKYKNTKIDNIQRKMFDKIVKMKTGSYSYRLASKVANNLNELLTNKSLTQTDIQNIRKDTISTYKEFILQFNKLSKK